MKKDLKYKKPPKAAEYILKRIFDDSLYRSAGDFEEIFNQIALDKGRFMGALWYWGQVMISLIPALLNTIRWRLAMIKNYIVLTFRNLFKYKVFSFINVSGLACGMACCLLITTWVLDEFSYDKFHKNAKHLYWVVENRDHSGENFRVQTTPPLLGPALRADFPEIKEAARFIPTRGLLFKHEDKMFYETSVFAVDPSFLKMFTFPFIEGDGSSALLNKYSMVISEKIAVKYFGTENPLEKAITINNEFDFTITGVMKDLPKNTTFHFNVLIPFEFISDRDPALNTWNSSSLETFVLLEDFASRDDVNAKIENVIQSKVSQSSTTLTLEPFTAMHLNSYSGYGRPIGRIKYVYIFSAVALFVLIIACINFMNLTTARSNNRAKEIGIKKVAGAQKTQLIWQFISESLILASIGMVLAVLFVSIVLPSFNQLSNKDLTLNFLKGKSIFLSLIGITLFTGILAGSYPAFFLSSLKPVHVLKGSIKSGSKGALFRKILVVTQFSISIFLIIGTWVVYSQLHYLKGKNLGFDKEQVLHIRMDGDLMPSYQPLKRELNNQAGVLGLSGTRHYPLYNYSYTREVDWEGKDPDRTAMIWINWVDFNYIETMKIEMLEGRGFSDEFSNDTSGAFLINEEAARMMGDGSPLGKRFAFQGEEGRIVGVMKNFHYQRIQTKIEPLVLTVAPDRVNYMLIRLNPQNILSTIASLKEAWKKVLPDYSFEYSFLNEAIDRGTYKEENMGILFRTFSMIAIMIACLGLYGLAAFMVEQRTKEIGIRKVLGASERKIISLLCRESVVLVAMANFIALPIAAYAANQWLQGFAYRTELKITIFALSAALALMIALLTVAHQAFKLARANPVDSIRYG